MVAKHNKLTELSRQQHQKILSYKRKNFQRPLYNAFMRNQSVECSDLNLSYLMSAINILLLHYTYLMNY